ncbi:ATP-binding protein [Halpernia frigidisoli]|uniref:ATPase family associated with various cellular activities (AAA) n=1 Tax=Halpernia frigidisoli TaxID=1125876 RepID=A0A1I3D2M3_9FLAO|nr:ATP-binding protein [Halpernia frigidisoli]SFH80962.1 ATPase family associated with various cellular activities (AAA) [Halpernia frigidisoli]
MAVFKNVDCDDFIGYKDLFDYISDAVEPFIGKEESDNWGIQKPAGIILYGPPGSGKIFWANKIAEITKYQFKEVKQHYLGATFVNGKHEDFNHFLVNAIKEENVLLFLEDFNTLMQEKNSPESANYEDQETKEIVLHYISKFEKEGVLVIGSADFLQGIDPEILAPGRFDVLIPIFPPNADERAELLLFNMIKDLNDKADLLTILKESKADSIDFWKPISEKMKAFSNTMIIDFTQSLKKKLRKEFLKNKDNKLIGEKLLESALKEASSKLTPDYLNKVDQFVEDVKKNNSDDFEDRILSLEAELETYKIQPKSENPIGFHHNE